MSVCSVKYNCRHRYSCDFCIEYSDYSPEDKRIYSPRQINAREKKREEKKELKSSEASLRGKRNKRAGYQSERGMVAKYQKWGFEAERQPLSGLLKGKLAGDIKVLIKDKWRRHEHKKRQDFNSYYTMTENGPIMISAFYVMMSEDDFHAALLEIIPEYVEIVEDKRFKKLHEFFDQDDSDIVSMKMHGRQKNVYAVTLDFWRELCGNNNPQGVNGTKDPGR